MLTLPAAAKVLGVLVDGVPVGALGPGWLGDWAPPASVIGEHPQPLGLEYVGVVHTPSTSGLVSQRRTRWVVAVAVAVALVAPVVRIGGQPVAGWDAEVAMQHRPPGGMLVDQIGTGGVGVAAKVAGDRLEQDARRVQKPGRVG